VRSLRKAASFSYRKASAGVADAVGTTRRHSADAAVMSPCRSSPESGFARRRRRSTGEPGKTPTRRSKEEARKEDAAHRARVLAARLLQWRFTNARLEKAMARATSAAQVSHAYLRMRFLVYTITSHTHMMGVAWGMQRKLFYAWLRVAELRNIHAAKQIVAQRWRQKIKLGRVLRTQLPLLGTWEEPIGESHADAVAELGRVLSAASASLPLTDGAQVRVTKMFACVRTGRLYLLLRTDNCRPT
jgi:hypothetical protein